MTRHYGLRAKPVILNTQPLTMRQEIARALVRLRGWAAFRLKVLFGLRFR